VTNVISRAAWMIVAGSLILGVVGCSGDSSSPRVEAPSASSSSVASTTTTTLIGTALRRGDRYVALGD